MQDMVLLKLLIISILFPAFTMPQKVLYNGRQKTSENRLLAKLLSSNSKGNEKRASALKQLRISPRMMRYSGGDQERAERGLGRDKDVAINIVEDEHQALRMGSSEESSFSSERETYRKKRILKNISINEAPVELNNNKQNNSGNESIDSERISTRYPNYDSKDTIDGPNAPSNNLDSREYSISHDTSTEYGDYGWNQTETQTDESDEGADIQFSTQLEAMVRTLMLSGVKAEFLRQTLRRRWRSCGKRACNDACRDVAAKFCTDYSCTSSRLRKLKRECRRQCREQFY